MVRDVDGYITSKDYRALYKMTKDEVQELIDLSPKQKKAWRKLELAIALCKKENIYFYQNMQTLGGLNGHNVERVDEEGYIGLNRDDPTCLHWLTFPTVETECSFADDTHYVSLKKQTL